MSSAYARVYYIPDYVTYTWCKNQKDQYQKFLLDYAEMANEPVDNIVEEAGLDLYDALDNLKEKGILYLAQYSGESKKLLGMIDLLSLFNVCSFPCGGGGYDDAFINLNTENERTNEKLELLIKMNLEMKFKGVD